MAFRFPPWVIVLAVLALQSGGCATNPYTKRWQLLMIPQSYETSLGAQAYQDVLSDPKVKVSQDPAEEDPVQRVSARIIEAAKHSKYAESAKEFQWDVTVIKDTIRPRTPLPYREEKSPSIPASSRSLRMKQASRQSLGTK